jgi:hypothetical protein
MIKTIVAADVIKEFGHLISCLVLLYLGHHLSFPSTKNMQAALMVDTIVLLALIYQETMTGLHLVHPVNTTKAMAA